jgi:uncharacterized membrane protein
MDMFDLFATQTAHIVSRVLELAGLTIIAAGAVVTLFLFVRKMAQRRDVIQAVAEFRSSLGRAILLGLEFLIAGDIINTVAVRPTLMSVAVLAGIVAIRTFLSFSLELEIEGRWPWQRRRGEQREV